MSRLDLREVLILFIDKMLLLLEKLHAVALENTETIMPGHTHLSQAQPITLATYLLSIFDGLSRGLDQRESAYRDTNRNSAGCGATSGITWPIDRWQLTDLVGFDDLVEPTYDTEAAQDHSLSILFALANNMLLISMSTMDFNIWGMEETGMIKVDPAWHGVSSMMPNKSISGALFERKRIEASWVIGYMQMGVSFCKGEPHADMLPMLEVHKVALDAFARAGGGHGIVWRHDRRRHPATRSHAGVCPRWLFLRHGSRRALGQATGLRSTAGSSRPLCARWSPAVPTAWENTIPPMSTFTPAWRGL